MPMNKIVKQRIKYVMSDFFMSFIAFALFNYCRWKVLDLQSTGYAGYVAYFFTRKMVAEQLFFPVLMLGVYWLSGYYNKPYGKSRLQEFFTTFLSVLLNTLMLFLLLLTNDMVSVIETNYRLLLILFGCLFILTYAGRCIITMHSVNAMKSRKLCFRTLIIGNSQKAHEFAHKLETSPTLLGYEVSGFVDIPGEKAYGTSGYRFEEIEECISRLGVTQVIISPEDFDDGRIMSLLRRLYDLNVTVKIAPSTFSYVTLGIHLNDIYAEPLIELTSPRISESTKNVKRVLDVMFSSLALIVLSPLYLAIALGVKLTSPGGIIYKQERIGLRQRPFKIYKFRSMREDAEAGGPSLSSMNDPRITRFGHFLRKYRLDELPQFWNVVKGDMSLVGPRPEREYYIREIVKEAPYYNMLHQIRPGITSWGMVKYGYAKTTGEMISRAQYDLVYLMNMSISVDVKIIIYTVKTVLSGAGM